MDMKSHTGDTVTSPASTVVDEATEACLYRLPRERLAGTTAFSVGYRGTLRPFHARLVQHRIGDDRAGEAYAVIAKHRHPRIGGGYRRGKRPKQVLGG